MSALSNYLENKLLDHALRATAYTAPTTLHVALYTSNPTDADTGTEVSGGSYARVSLTPATAFGAAAAGSISNAADITFTTATAAWGTITHFAIRDAATAGNMLVYGALTASKVVANGDTFRFPAASLTITLD